MQHGFVRGRSCLTFLLETLEKWTSALDEGFGIDSIYLNYPKSMQHGSTQKTRYEIARLWNIWTAIELVNGFSNS